MFAEKPNKFIPEATVKIIREVVGTDKMEVPVSDERFASSFFVTLLYTITQSGIKNADGYMKKTVRIYTQKNC